MTAPPETEKLRRVLRAGPALRLAVLFGSAARGESQPTSDLDVAILPGDPDLPLADELALQAELAKAVAREVDLVRIDHASTVLRWKIATEGQLLVERPGELTRFQASAAAEYLDFRPALERAQRTYRRRLASAHREAAP